MKSSFLFAAASIAALMLAGTASAADLMAPPAQPVVDTTSDWDGFYLGINGGYGQANRTGSSTDFFFPGGQPFNYSLTGGLIGVDAGFNYTLGSNFVLGVQVDGDVANITGSDASQVVGGGPGTYSWLVTGLGKLGYAPSGNMMFYLDGGYGFAGFNFSGSAGCTFSETRSGAVAGVGATFKVTDNASIDLNYNHYFLQPATTNCTALGFDPVTNTSTSGIDVVKVGMNWAFK